MPGNRVSFTAPVTASQAHATLPAALSRGGTAWRTPKFRVGKAMARRPWPPSPIPGPEPSSRKLNELTLILKADRRSQRKRFFSSRKPRPPRMENSLYCWPTLNRAERVSAYPWEAAPPSALPTQVKSCTKTVKVIPGNNDCR
jgi:hypothetical protein